MQGDGLCMEKRANLRLGDGALVSADLQRASSVPVGDVGRCDGAAGHYTRGTRISITPGTKPRKIQGRTSEQTSCHIVRIQAFSRNLRIYQRIAKTGITVKLMSRQVFGPDFGTQY